MEVKVSLLHAKSYYINLLPPPHFLTVSSHRNFCVASCRHNVLRS